MGEQYASIPAFWTLFVCVHKLTHSLSDWLTGWMFHQNTIKAARRPYLPVFICSGFSFPPENKQKRFRFFWSFAIQKQNEFLFPLFMINRQKLAAVVVLELNNWWPHTLPNGQTDSTKRKEKSEIGFFFVCLQCYSISACRSWLIFVSFLFPLPKQINWTPLTTHPYGGKAIWLSHPDTRNKENTVVAH